MTKIHVNPKNGEPGECRAKKRCRFGADTPHFENTHEALAHYAETHNLEEFPAKNGVSQGAKILVQLEKMQKEITHLGELLDDFNEDRLPDNFTDEDYTNLRDSLFSKANLRDRLSATLNQLPWDDTDGKAYDDTITISSPKQRGLDDADNAVRKGFSNNEFRSKNILEEETYEFLDKASKLWISRLSTAEIKAVVRYNNSSDDYAEFVSSFVSSTGENEIEEDDEKYLQYFHSAMEKAPKTDRPFRVFSGLSHHRTKELNEQAETGAVTLNRVQSTSLNPAVINSFMDPSDWGEKGSGKSKDNTVFEFETNRIASMTAFHQHRQEVEILVGPGTFNVQKKLSEIVYDWGDKPEPFGRTSDNTFILTEA